MNRSISLFASLAVPVFMLAGLAANPAMAQDKAKDAKAAPAAKGMAKLTVLAENDKARVFEVQYKPGEENKAVPSSSHRVVRALKGGTLLRTFADGKTQNVEWKTGEVRFIEPDKTAYTAKNVGKTDVHLYVVVLKEAKK
jgi:hypothetical protein